MEPTTALLVANVISTLANVVNAHVLQKRNIAAQEKNHRDALRNQQELAREGHRLQRELAQQSQKFQIELQENQRALDAWPLTITPRQIVQYDHLLVPPLTVLLSPLHLKYDRLVNASQTDSIVDEGAFTEQIRKHIGRWYPLHDTTRPVQFMGASWRSKAIREEAAVHALFFYLKHHATLFLESGRAGTEIVFRVGYWNRDDEVPRIETIALAPHNGQTIEDLMRDLAAMNALFAAVLADVHHLVHSDATPVAPRILTQLVRNVRAPEFADAVGRLLDVYVVAAGSAGIGSELALDVAAALAAGEQKIAAEQYFRRSLGEWMKRHGVCPRDGDDAVVLVAKHAGVNDRTYVDALRRYLEETGDTNGAALLQASAKMLPMLPPPGAKPEWR